LDFILLFFVLVFGMVGLLYVLMCFYMVLLFKEVWCSVVWVIWIIGIFYLFILVFGYGVAVLVGLKEIVAVLGKVNSVVLLLVYELGGMWLFGIISVVVFVTIFVVVVGFIITVSVFFAYDIYVNVVKDGKVTQ